MEKTPPLAYKGRLVYIRQSGTRIELESFRFSKRLGFLDELVSKSTVSVSSKLRWKVKDVKNTVDSRCGIEAPTVLLSRTLSSGTTKHCTEGEDEKRLCVIQSNWSGGVATSHRNTTDDEQDRPTGKSRVDLTPLMEFTCSTSPLKTQLSLLHGPVVLVANQGTLSLFDMVMKSCIDSESKPEVYKKDFIICDTKADSDSTKPTSDQNTNANSSDSVDSCGELESTILCAVSEENWIISVVLVKRGRSDPEENHSASLVTVALERRSESDAFTRSPLTTRDFLPGAQAVAAADITSLTVHRCWRVPTQNGTFVYKSRCALALKDGRVVLLVDGEFQATICRTPWDQFASKHQAVTKLLNCGPDIWMCLTDNKHCYIVDEADKPDSEHWGDQVKQHWDNVSEALVGDFLQCGGQQVLLLFSDNTSAEGKEGPPDSYLLTDLQGLVIDHRHRGSRGDDDDNGSDECLGSEEMFAEDDSDKQGDGKQLQPVVDALLGQNQALARRVLEEEQRLACKQRFVGDTWRRLLKLSQGGQDCSTTTSSSLCAPEVPLANLLEGDETSGLNLAVRTDHSASPARPRVDIEVKYLWHRLVDTVCVVGVRVLNLSDRELIDCALVLTPSSAPSTRCGQTEVCARTAMWEHRHTEHLTPRQLWMINNGSSSSSSSCRQTAGHRGFCPGEISVLRPSALATVTCVVDVDRLAVHGRQTYHVHLLYTVRDSGGPQVQSVSCTAGDDGETKKKKEEKEEADSDNTETVTVREGPHQADSGLGALRNAGRTRSVECGEVVLQASELLHREVFPCLRKELVNNSQEGSDAAQAEAEVLTLSASQERWLFHLDVAMDSGHLARALRSAGFAYHPRLAQMWLCCRGVPRALRYVRAEVIGLGLPAPMSLRAATVLAYVRDSNQFLLLLRYLSTCLPDSNITTTHTAAPDSNPELLGRLTRCLSTQLSQIKTEARKVLNRDSADTSDPDHESDPYPQGKSGISRSQSVGPGTTKDALSQTTKTTTDEGKLCSESESSKSEREEFVEWQQTFCQLQTRSVGREEVGRFRAAVLHAQLETDIAFAKVKL